MLYVQVQQARRRRGRRVLLVGAARLPAPRPAWRRGRGCRGPVVVPQNYFGRGERAADVVGFSVCC